MANNVIQYVLNFTDPLTAPFIVNPYTSNGPTTPISGILDVSATNANSSLLFYGKGHPNYGERTEENFLNILESFSGSTEPANPVSGQLWYERFDIVNANGTWVIWNDSSGSWSTISPQPVQLTVAPVGTPSVGNQYQFDLTSGKLYYGVVISGHPLNGQWIERKFGSTTDSISNGATSPLPQKQLKVFTNDSRAWDAVSDIFVGPLAPTNPDVGTLWFDTSIGILKVYDGTMFDSIVTTGGVIPLINGGTGVAASTAGQALNALLPSQASNSGKFLSTDGANASWVTVAASGTGTVTSVAVVSGTAGITSVGGPITTSGTITLSLDIELQGITTLGTTGFVQRTGVGAYTAAALSLSDITTALGYTPVNKAGDSMTGNLSFDGTHQVSGLPASPTGSDPTAATSKAYVDNQDIAGVSFGGTTLTLTRGSGSILTTTIDMSYTGSSPAYLPISGENLNKLPIVPTTIDKAIHELDRSLKRRTKPKRFVSQGLANGGGTLVSGFYVYNTPSYEVGSSKLNFFIDGVKWVASTFGYQRVLFNYSGATSPPGFQSLGLNELSSNVVSALLPATTYDFNIVVDGGSPTNVTLNDPSIVTFGGLVALINARMATLSVTATAVLEDDNAITFYSNTHGTGSSISLSAGTNDVFSVTNIAFIDKLGTSSDGIAADRAQQSGATYGYHEVGNQGSISSTIRIDAANPERPTSANTLEFIVSGNNGNVYYDN